MARLWYIAVKDLVVWSRDATALGILLGMPLVLILILGSALGGAMESDIKVAVVDLSRGHATAAGGAKPPSDELIAAMLESERLDDLFDIEQLPSEKVARALIREGKLVAALVVPAGFDEDVASGRPVNLVVLKDPGSQTAAGIWESVVTAFATQFSAASVSVQTVVETVQRGNPMALAAGGGALVARAVEAVTGEDALDGVRVTDAQAAGVAQVTAIDYYGLSMVSMFLMFGAMFGAFSTIKENREQTMNRLLTTPSPRAGIVGGKMLSVFLLGMVQFLVLYSATRFLFGVEWGGNILATFVLAAAEMLAVTGLATLIAAFARTERAAGGIGPLVVQVQALIGGAFFAIAALPEWVQPVRYFSVIGWTMEGWVAVQTRGAGLGEVWPSVAALLAMSGVLFAIGVWRAEASR
ncbi:MAG: ABC transporter permease [Coriobacteriia bacterium]|nr:ABC transporter permease [Coriobacteriia bacterium]